MAEKTVTQEILTFRYPFRSDESLRATETMTVDLVLQGSGVHRLFGQSVPCEAGELFLVPENVAHDYFASENGDVPVVLRLSFSPGEWLDARNGDPLSPDYCFGAFRDGAAVAYAKLTQGGRREVRRLIDEIAEEEAAKKCAWQDAVRADLSLLLIGISRCAANAIRENAAPVRERGIVLSAIRLVEDRYGESELTLESIAASMFVSQSTLSRSFSAYMGQPFSDFLRGYRMNRAARLLRETDETIGDIVARCGLKDLPTFYRSFARYMGTTPNQYRKKTQKQNKNKQGETTTMSILTDISENLQIGKAKLVKELVEKAIADGIDAKTILNEGLLPGMNIVGEKFKNNEIYIPEVLVAARALNMGTAALKPYFGEAGLQTVGKVCLGTVQGDLHDIGKNLVKMMMEGKQLEVVDLGTDVSAETFVKTAIEENCSVICCSALLTTTMEVMRQVVEEAEKQGVRDKVKIMIGGAPVSEDYCRAIGADVYTVDAASAAEAAVELCKNA